MVKIEADSTNTKNHVIRDIIEESKTNGKDSWFCIVRGSLYKTENFHLHSLLSSKDARNFIKGMIYESKTNKNSRQQVDYIICAFTNPVGLISVRKEKEESLESFKNRVLEASKVKKEDLEGEKSNLVIIVFSEKKYEVMTYGRVSSEDGSSVVSPMPIMSDSGDVNKSRILIQDKLVVDFFDVLPEEFEEVEKEGAKLGHLFKDDKKVFYVKSEFISGKKVKKEKKNKKNKKDVKVAKL